MPSGEDRLVASLLTLSVPIFVLDEILHQARVSLGYMFFLNVGILLDRYGT